MVIVIHLKREYEFYKLVQIKYRVSKQNTSQETEAWILGIELAMTFFNMSGADMLRKPTLLQQSSHSISAARLLQRCKLRTNFRGLKIVSLDFPTRFGAVHEISSRGRGQVLQCLVVKFVSK